MGFAMCCQVAPMEKGLVTFTTFVGFLSLMYLVVVDEGAVGAESHVPLTLVTHIVPYARVCAHMYRQHMRQIVLFRAKGASILLGFFAVGIAVASQRLLVQKLFPALVANERFESLLVSLLMLLQSRLLHEHIVAFIAFEVLLLLVRGHMLRQRPLGGEGRTALVARIHPLGVVHLDVDL